MAFLYLLSTPEPDLELAQAELWAMTGCEAEGLVGVSKVACDVSRSAYIAACAEVIAQAADFGELRDAVRKCRLDAEGFRIEVRKLSPKVALGSPEIACSLADVMEGLPDLDRPRARFLALCREGEWTFARILSATRRGYLQQATRPHNFSLALTARHARALVNLVAAPGDALLDPCCGIGTCLIEARLMGVRALGCDVSLPCVFAAAENLAHLGLPGGLQAADARQVGGVFDAAVIDFPYGHTSRVSEGLYREILNNVAPRVFRLGVVTGGPEEELFADLGLDVLRCAHVRANRLVRHFYVLAGGR